MQKTGDLISDLVVPEDLDTSETEASIEVNLAIVKFKYTVMKGTKISYAPYRNLNERPTSTACCAGM